MSWSPSAHARRTLAAAAGALVLLAGLLALRAALVDPPLARLRRGPGAAAGRTAYDGSWWFPRGGPYILGYESPGGPAELRVDGAVVVRGAGERTGRVLYEPGAHAVHFEAPSGARLLWHPPGRRGADELEYVPPSSLSAEDPTAARFSAWAGASPVDGVLALAGLAIILAACAYAARRGLAAIDRRAAVAAAAVFAVALAVRLWGLGDAGQTWDEDVNWSAGRNYVTNLLSLDFRASSWRWNYQHPPVMKYLAGIGAQLADGYGPARAISAVLVAAACALCVFIGRRLFSLRVGVAGGVLAALTPHLIAHGQIVGHEAPTVLLWTLVFLLALGAHDRGPNPASEASLGPKEMPNDRSADRGDDPAALPRRMLLLGVLLGLAVFSRFANVLLASLIGLVLLAGAPPGRRTRTVRLGMSLMPIVVLAVGFLIWPRLWTEPLAHLAQAWRKLSQVHDPEPYLGAVTATPPRTYFAVYLAATAPLGLLAGALVWAGVAVVRRRRADLMLALFLLTPLLIAASPVRQDGVRYILPSLVALALAAAAGLDAAAGWLVRRAPPTVAARAPVVLLAALCLYAGVCAVRVRPYYLDYYGEQVGGPARVLRRRWFEIGWWGEGLAPAVDYVDRNAAPGARVDRRRAIPGHVTWMRADLFAAEVKSGPASDADWWIVNLLAVRPFSPPPGARLVFEERVLGAPLARVYRRDSPPASPPR